MLLLRDLAHQAPLRLAAGAFVLNSGLEKRGADEVTAKGYHGQAATAYPFLGEMEPRRFLSLLSSAEIAVGSVLLFPLVPEGLAGLALTGFAAGLVGFYLRTPGLRRKGSLRPTDQGIPLAKDSWLLGIGLSLLADDLVRNMYRLRR
ncbi:hypothetical protein O7635_15250 [Asanoa sp. WMMD1127]|uniref:hypothetical protein n=1 Tax=Asanoa sp. WMMD1127 TaxID=3016107 RepID=UPI00241725AA|nr:hypothetical protein [Asanoa sp. WMMD1127]MDG4823212.1 hypothetical protein [Asanoa sp. WMMD1127]